MDSSPCRPRLRRLLCFNLDSPEIQWPDNQLGLEDSDGLPPDEPRMELVVEQREFPLLSSDDVILPCESQAETVLDTAEDEDTSQFSFDLNDQDRVRSECLAARRGGRRWKTLKQVRQIHLKKLQIVRLHLFFFRCVITMINLDIFFPLP